VRRHAPILAVILAVAYLALALLATACVTDHAEAAVPQHHSQHGSNLSHSSFCAWACQANPTSGGAVQTPVSEPIAVARAVLRPELPGEAGPIQSLRASRAPPVRF